MFSLVLLLISITVLFAVLLDLPFCYFIGELLDFGLYAGPNRA